VGRQLATLVLVASGLLLAWVTLVGIVVAQDLPSHAEPILVFVGLAWIGWCVGLSVWREHRRRTPGDAHANSRRLSADTPPPDYRDDEDVSG
jgi:hypothetical protein